MQALNIRVKHDQQPWVNEEGNQKKDCEGSAYLLKPMQLLLHSKRTFYQGLLKSSQSALAEKEGLMYVQWKGLNQARDTIKQGNCKITIKFCHCHRMIYDRINKTEKEKQRMERRRISWTGARLSETERCRCRNKRRERKDFLQNIRFNTSDISALTESKSASPAFILSCHCNIVSLSLKRPRDISTFVNMTDVQ